MSSPQYVVEFYDKVKLYAFNFLRDLVFCLKGLHLFIACSSITLLIYPIYDKFFFKDKARNYFLPEYPPNKIFFQDKNLITKNIHSISEQIPVVLSPYIYQFSLEDIRRIMQKT